MKRRIGIGRTSGTFIGLMSLGLLLLLPSIVVGSLGLVSDTKPAPPVAPGLVTGLLQQLPPPPIPLPPNAAHNPLYVAMPTTPPVPTVTTPPGVSATVSSSLSVADTLSPGSTASSRFSVTDTGHTALSEIALAIHGAPGVVAPYVTVGLSSPNGSTSLPLTSALAGSELMVPVAIQPGGTATLTLTVSLTQTAPPSVEGATSGYTLALYAS